MQKKRKSLNIFSPRLTWISRLLADYVWRWWSNEIESEVRKKILRSERESHESLFGCKRQLRGTKRVFPPSARVISPRKDQAEARYGKTVVCERESIKRTLCEKKTIFNSISCIADSFSNRKVFLDSGELFVFTFEWKQSETSRRTAAYETDGKIIYSQKKSSDKRLLIFFTLFSRNSYVCLLRKMELENEQTLSFLWFSREFLSSTWQAGAEGTRWSAKTAA